MKHLAERYRFFREHAGGVVGQSAVVAMHLARAEARAEELGLRWDHEPEREPWDGDCPAPEYNRTVYVYDPNDPGGCWLASLGQVGVNLYEDPYLRVCAAELFAEVLSEPVYRPGKPGARCETSRRPWHHVGELHEAGAVRAEGPDVHTTGEK